jgi:cell division protein FtsZ
MIFITAGMGGGTGTGAAPVVAKLAKERGILTVGVVTKPFQFEGGRRMAAAEAGIAELSKHVDTLIIIPNQNLFRIANEKTTFTDAFKMADDVLHSGVRGITDLMMMPGLINLDFADVNTTMNSMGKAMMGTGEAEGDNRAIEAAQSAISNPLLDEVSMKGARAVIINISGGEDVTLFEIDEIANHIRGEVDPEANIIVGTARSDDLSGKIRVSVVATGLDVTALPDHVGIERPSNVAMFKALDKNTTAEQDEVIEEDVFETSESMALDLAEALEEALEPEDESEDFEDVNSEIEIEDAFIAPEAKMPSDTLEPEGRPDPFAEAAMNNGLGRTMVEGSDNSPQAKRPTAKRKQENSGGQSLFERMTGGWMSGDDGANDSASGVLANEEVLEKEEAAPKENSLGFGPLMAEDRPAPQMEDDDLSIPSFLKRKIAK